MKILVLGATSKVGLALTDAALAAGHDLVVLARNPTKLGDCAERVSVLTGDYFDPATQSAALQGVDAVLTTVGPPMRRGQSSGDYAAAMRTFTSAMQAASVSRIVAIGGAGIRLGDEPVALRRAVMRRILTLMAGDNYRIKEAEHNVLFNSDLDWTIVRPPQVATKDGTFTITQDHPAGMTVDSNQLAAFMLESLTNDATIRTAPFVATT